ncbi:MAG: LamG-like jellyroll fold domain-containing protein [Kiritimatiellales bacterium]
MKKINEQIAQRRQEFHKRGGHSAEIRVLSLVVVLLGCTLKADPWQSNYNWRNLHLRTAAQRDDGLIGGEGYQRLMDIKFAPSDPSIVYLCTDTSQVWKSIDGGASWIPKPNGLMGNGGSSLIVNRTNANEVLVAAFPNDGAGIYRTTDGGDNWTRTYTNTGYSGTVGENLFYQYSSTTYFAALQNGNGLLVSASNGASWYLVTFDSTSDIQNNEIGVINNMVQNPYAATWDLELWICSSSGLYKVSKSVTNPGQYHCVEVTATGLPSKYTGWTRTADPAGTRTMLDSITYYSSPCSVCLDITNSTISSYWHTKWSSVSVSAGTEYVLEGYIKTEDLETVGYGGVYLSAQDVRGSTYGAWNTSKIKGTAGWTNVTMTFTIPSDSDTTALKIVLYRLATAAVNGKAWYDNIKLYPSSVGPSGNLLLTAKGLEDYSTFNGDSPTSIRFGDSSGKIFASCGLSGIYKSTDNGQSFSPANNGISTYYTGLKRMRLNGSDADGDVLVAGFDIVGGRGSYISTDGAVNWSEILNEDLTNSYLVDDICPVEAKNVNYYTTATGFHPTNSSIMLHAFAHSIIYKSTNTGSTWFYSGEGYSGGRAAGGFAFGGSSDPRATYQFLTDFGPLVTYDSGRTWERLLPPGGDGYNSNAGVIDPDDSQIVLCSIGARTSQIIDRSIDGGTNWDVNLTGTAANYTFMAMDPTNSLTVFLDNYRSYDWGDSWSTLSKSVVAICPGTGAIYAKEQGATSSKTKISKSTDNGINWTPYANEIPLSPASIAEIAVSPADEDRVYAAAQYSGVYILQDDGSWLLRNENNGITKDSFGNYNVLHITVDPINPDVVYIGKRVQWKGHSDGVCVSTDAGLSWTNISGNMSAYSTVWKVKANPNNDAVYIATSHGTWVMSSLILNYHFDETAGSTVYNDSIYSISDEVSEEGDAVRGTGTAITTGLKGSALSFDGTTNAYVALSSYPSVLSDITTSFSVEALVWFNDSNARKNGPIVSDRNLYSTWNGFFFRSWYSYLSFTVAKDSTHYYNLQATNYLASGQWYHFVGTFDNGNMKLYVDGELKASGSAGFTNFTMQAVSPLYIGQSGVNPTNFNGKIDEVKIYNRVLGQPEVVNRCNYFKNQ